MPEFPCDVSVGIVAHDAMPTLPAVLESLKKAGCPVSQITVFDVCSSDGGPDWLASYWPSVSVVRFDSNCGPNPVRNFAILNAQTPYVVLLDADVFLQADTVQLLRSVMVQDASIAIGSPIVLYADRPETIQYAGTGLHFMCEAVNAWQGRSVRERGPKAEDIGCASGCALLISRDPAIKVGLFDERYFLGKDDGDFTHRIKIAGYKIIEVPQARVIHCSGSRGPSLYFYQLRNRWHFMLKNYQLRTLICLAPILLVHEALQVTMLTFKGYGLTYLKALFALINMLKGVRADRARIANFRVREDWEILASGRMVVREDILGHVFLKRLKIVYESLLCTYWAVLRRTVLR
jgi:GT2 family glycosyltransferase